MTILSPQRVAHLQAGTKARCEYEMSLLQAELPARGFTVRLVRQVELENLELPANALAAGEVDFVLEAMSRMGIPEPEPRDYPSSLWSHLHRRLWRGTLLELRRLAEGGGLPLFVKPAARRKLFRGRVLQWPEDVEALSRFPAETEVWLAEVLPFVSEFRCYVIGDRIACVENYDGDPHDRVDLAVVRDAVARLARSGEGYSAYTIDFGLLRDGRTALIEMNDGFSVGSYREVSAADYAEMTISRWDELLAMRP